jgi:hypothetical protein
MVSSKEPLPIVLPVMLTRHFMLEPLDQNVLYVITRQIGIRRNLIWRIPNPPAEKAVVE